MGRPLADSVQVYARNYGEVTLESSKSLNSLDPGLRRDDVVSLKRVFLDATA